MDIRFWIIFCLCLLICGQILFAHIFFPIDNDQIKKKEGILDNITDIKDETIDKYFTPLKEAKEMLFYKVFGYIPAFWFLIALFVSWALGFLGKIIRFIQGLKMMLAV